MTSKFLKFGSVFIVAIGVSHSALGQGAGMNDPTNSTQLPEVKVSATPPLAETQAVGPYAQPEWTTRRRFPTTRVYVQRLPWEIGFEQWWRGRFFRDGSASHLLQEEVEVGLPYRVQLDLYENWTIDDDRRMRHHDVATEARWALADWGKIPLNPTLYGEWKFVDKTQGPDVYEVKLLLGEELAPRWHWGFNAAYEQEVGGSRTTEWAWSQGISYTVFDEKLNAGVEMKLSHETEKGSRDHAEISFVIGPSLQWQITRWAHLDLVPLFGTTGDSPRVEAYAVLSFDLWPGERGREPRGPTSLRGN